MAVELALVEAPTEADRDAIHRPLIAYNAAKAGPAHYQPLAIVLGMVEDTPGNHLQANATFWWSDVRKG